jgi:hypothetical protein
MSQKQGQSQLRSASFHATDVFEGPAVVASVEIAAASLTT